MLQHFELLLCFLLGHYESHHPPDILEHPNVGADRNLFIQTGELNNQHEQSVQREPVDGGNENLAPNVNDLPMHRLVLGESDPNPRVITGSNVEERSEAVGSEGQMNPGLPPTGTGNILPEAERSETVGSASVPPPPLPAGKANF